MLGFVASEMHLPVPTTSVGPTTYARSAALFRQGLLLNAAHAGRINAGPDAPHGKFDGPGMPTHASNAQMTAAPLLAVSGGQDVLAPTSLVERWREVSGGGFSFATAQADDHLMLRDDQKVYRTVYTQLAGCAIERAVAAARLVDGSAESQAHRSSDPPIARPAPVSTDAANTDRAEAPTATVCDPATLIAPLCVAEQGDNGKHGAGGGSSCKGSLGARCESLAELTLPNDSPPLSPLLRAAAMVRSGARSKGSSPGGSRRGSPTATPSPGGSPGLMRIGPPVLQRAHSYTPLRRSFLSVGKSDQGEIKHRRQADENDIGAGADRHTSEAPSDPLSPTLNMV